MNDSLHYYNTVTIFGNPHVQTNDDGDDEGNDDNDDGVGSGPYPQGVWDFVLSNK